MKIYSWKKRLVQLLISLVIGSSVSQAAPAPEWWAWEDDDSGLVVFNANAPLANNAVANIGQAKWMAYRALMELRAVLPQSASRIEKKLADFDIVSNWSFPVTAAEKQDHLKPLNTGQLKALAAPFYDELQDVAKVWLEAEMDRYGTKQTVGNFAEIWPQNPYPWGPNVGGAEHYAVANIGQLKAVFALDFWADRESPADGVSDLWEQYLANLDPFDGFSTIAQISSTNVDDLGDDLGVGKHPEIVDPETSPFAAELDVQVMTRRVEVLYSETGSPPEVTGDTTISAIFPPPVNVEVETIEDEVKSFGQLEALRDSRISQTPLTSPGQDLSVGNIKAQVDTDATGTTVETRGAKVVYVSANPAPYNLRISRIVVTREIDSSNGNALIESVKPVTFLIARGGTRSQEVDMLPEIQAGKTIKMYLVAVAGTGVPGEVTNGAGSFAEGYVESHTLSVNDGDTDSDHVLDYADGISDKFPTLGDPSGLTESADFFAIALDVPSESTNVTVAYVGSDPGAMTFVPNPSEGEPSQVLPTSGLLRLWSKDGSETRSLTDYVAPGTGTAASFGATPSSLEIELYVESVKVSEDIGDQEVRIAIEQTDGSIIEHIYLFTSTRTAFHSIGEDDSTYRLYGLRPSLPHPTIDDAQVSVSDLKPTADGAGLTADILITGKVHSAICDITPGEIDGVIKTAYIGINGDAPIATTDQTHTLTWSKEDGAGSMARPHPYEGYINKTINDIPIIEGNNTVKVSVHDPVYGLSGTVTVPFEVQALPPGGGNATGEGIVVEFPGTGVGTIRVNYSVNGTPGNSVFEGKDFTCDPINPALYEYLSGPSASSVTFSAYPGLNSQVIDTLTFSLVYQDPSGTTDYGTFTVQETDVASKIFAWGDTNVTYSNYIGWTVSNQGTGTADVTGEGEFNPMALRIDGPDDFISGLRSLNVTTSQGDGDEIYLPITRSTVDNKFYIGHEDRPRSVGAAIASPMQSQAHLDPGFDLTAATNPVADTDWVDEPGDPKLGDLRYTFNFLDRNRDGELSGADIAAQISKQAALFAGDAVDFQFYKGYVKGFFGNPIDSGKDLWGLAKKALKVSWVLSPPGLIHEFACGDKFESEIKAAKVAWDKGKDVLAKAKTWIPKAMNFMEKLGKNGTNSIITYLQTGQFPGAEGLSEEERIAIDVVFMLIMMADNWWSSQTPSDRGYACGYIAFEIVAAVAAGIITIEAGGAGAAVLLSRHVPKLLMLLRNVRPVLEGLTNIPAGSPLKKLIDKLNDIDIPLIKAKAGKWCFVAGTPILTVSGMVPIESIEPGMVVLSAHEDSQGAVQARPVIAVSRNIATELVTVSYDHDNDQETPDAVIETTSEHPFFVEEDEGFVPAGSMQSGNTLRLATGASTNVSSVVTRSGVRVPVYNFAVADFHTYFAGPGGVWVHNLCTEALDRYAGTHRAFVEEAIAGGASPADALDGALAKIIQKSNADELTEGEMDEVLAYIYDELPSDALNAQTVGQWDDIMDLKSQRLGNFNRGNAADRIRDVFYRTRGGGSQIRIVRPDGNPHHFKLDNYIPGQEIVSRKDTDLTDTITDGLLEMGDKYAVGRVVADTPHNRAQLGAAAVNQPLNGNLILEIPPRLNSNPLPSGVTTMAENLGIIVRDYSGKVLTSSP